MSPGCEHREALKAAYPHDQRTEVPCGVICEENVRNLGLIDVALNKADTVALLDDKLFGLPLDAILGMGSAINPAVKDLTSFVILMVAPINIIKGVGISVLTMLIYKKVSPIIKYGRTMTEGQSR